MKAPRLTLVLPGSPEAASFVKAVTAFFALINDVVKEEGGDLRVLVEVESGSQKIIARLAPRTGKKTGEASAVARRVVGGVKQLSARPQRPHSFSDDALRHTKRLVEAAGRDEGALVEFGRGKALLRPRAAESVDRLLASYSLLGSIEGHLYLLSSKTKLRMEIQDHLTGRRIRCDVPRQLLAKALESFEHLVSVWGEIRYNERHEPTSILVDDFVRLPEGVAPEVVQRHWESSEVPH